MEMPVNSPIEQSSKKRKLFIRVLILVAGISSLFFVRWILNRGAEAGKSGFIEQGKRIQAISGKITTSLYSAIVDRLNSPDLAMDLADIFAWQIDFLTDCRVDDMFLLVWEEEVSQGKIVPKTRHVIVAQYRGRKESHTAVYFKDPSGKGDYYAPNGDALRKSFLRSPLNYRRITSYFSMSRFHPILKTYRPHLGIDYGAPTGTPVSSLGEGVIEYAGWKGGYGKYMQVRHHQGFETCYGHLSAFAKGIKKGVKVNQGQVIGYVGATGMATGPHLDFRVIQNGRFVNFLKLKVPPAEAVNEKFRKEFNRTVKESLSLYVEERTVGICANSCFLRGNRLTL